MLDSNSGVQAEARGHETLLEPELQFHQGHNLSSLQFSLPSAGSLWTQYLVGHLALVALVHALSRWSLLNGFALVAVVQMSQELRKSGITLWEAISAETIAPAGVLFPLLCLLGGVVVAMRLSRALRVTGGSSPAGGPFPLSGFAPAVWGAAVLTLPSSIGTLVPATRDIVYSLQHSAWLAQAVAATVATASTLFLSWVFFRPAAVGALWVHWVKNADRAAVVKQASGLLSRGVLQGGAVMVALPFLFFVLGIRVNGASAVGFIACALAVLDAVEEWQARRALGRLVAVRSVHRMAEVEPVCTALQQSGIPCFPRSSAYRATLQFFGPYVPVEILVPQSRRNEALQFLERAGRSE